jgi:hypothetical protein
MDAIAEPRGFAATCLVETTEGPVAIAETPGKGFPVLTRLPSGALGFRQLLKVSASGPVPLVRVVLTTGLEVIVARGHPFFRAGMQPVAASALAPGDALETAHHYPAGYVPRGAPADATGPHVAVRAVEAAGEGQVFTGTVHETHVLFVTAGVLCGE